MSGLRAINGTKTFSSKWPCRPPIAIAWSLPITCAATWVTTSGMTGLTLPGMIELPFWSSGRKISPSPARGPEPRQRVRNARDALAHLRGVPAELLPERHGHSVHPVRAAGLDDVVELHGPGGERGRQALERGQQVVCRLVQRGEMHGRREDVVRGLPHVHVVVRVDALAGEGGDHLVRVHVRGGARAGLEDVDRELVVELARRGAGGGGGGPLGPAGVAQGEG